MSDIVITERDYRDYIDECMAAQESMATLQHAPGLPSGCPMSRRDAVAWGGAGFSAMVMLGVSAAGCKPRNDDRASAVMSSSTTGAGYGPFLSAYMAAPDQMDTTKAPNQQPPWKAVIAGTWIKRNPYPMLAELREKSPILATPGFPTIVTTYADVQRILHVKKWVNGAYSEDPNTDFVVRHNTDTITAVAGKPTSILGQYDVPQHDIDKKYGARGIAIKDEAKVRAMIRRNVEDLLKNVSRQQTGELDIVQTLARWIPVRVGSEFFGVTSGPQVFMEITEMKVVVYDYDYKAEDYKAPKPFDKVKPLALTHAEIFGARVGDKINIREAEIYEWIANCFNCWFLNLSDTNMRVRELGVKSGQKLMAYMQYLVKRRMQKPPQTESDDLLGRYVYMYHHDREMRAEFDEYFEREVKPSGLMTYDEYVIQRLANYCGAIGGSIVNIEKFFTNTMAVLLRPENRQHLRDAEAAARRWQEKGDVAGNADRITVERYMLEAQRFWPQNDAIARIVTSDQVFRSPIPLLNGSTEVRVPASPDIDNIRNRTTILAAVASAMMDPVKFPNPDEIVITDDVRIRDYENAYFHMGGTTSRHECLGKYLVPIEVTEAMRGLLLLGNLAEKEPIKYGDQLNPQTGRPFPENYMVTFRKA